MKHVLITICGRAGSKGMKSKNLREFCGFPIVYYSLSAAELFMRERSDLDIDICLSTDSPELRDTVLARCGEVSYLERRAALAQDDVPKEDVYRDCLVRMEQLTGKRYDALIDLDITSPLRQKQDLPGIVALFESDPNIDVALSAAESRRNPYYNMGQEGPNGYAVRVIENRNTARQQAPLCYDFNASLYVFDRDFLAERMVFDLWEGNMKAYLMYDTGILDIDSEDDFKLIEVLGQYLFENVDGFKAIRDNIQKEGQ